MTRATYGTLPIQTLRELIERGEIIGANEEHLQPSSMDLPISIEEVYRMRGSFLPRPQESISDLVKRGSIGNQIPIGTPLRRDDVYLIRLAISLKLHESVGGSASSKSSTGRIDARCRLLADKVSRYDYIPKGYHGDLWIEVVPKSFDIILSEKMCLNQLRLFYGDGRLNVIEHEMAFAKYNLLRARDGSALPGADRITPDGVLMTVDLSSNEIIAYRSKNHWRAVDLSQLKSANPNDYFEAIHRPANDELVLKPGEFYLLGTKERISIPPCYAAEMVQYNATIGNLFTHFAGFFDPGFGWRADGDTSIKGNVAVLEVEVHSSSTVLRDGQPICIMAYEKMLREPETMYGSGINSNYGIQDDIKLAKFFRES